MLLTLGDDVKPAGLTVCARVLSYAGAVRARGGYPAAVVDEIGEKLAVAGEHGPDGVAGRIEMADGDGADRRPLLRHAASWLKLIPYTSSGAGRPMIVARTVEGNHMRQHREGGRSNQREVDVIAQEVIPKYCRGFAGTEIGITTPYRHQASKAADVLDQAEADTVHKFQGRQKQVVILTTVLDETGRWPNVVDAAPMSS